jgi:hypothetical protein
MLTSGQIQRSIQKFSDYGEDLLRSDYNTFDDRLKVFIKFCETDPVFSQIHRQILSVKRLNFDEWLEQGTKSVGSMVGSGQLDLPTDEEQRIATIYELLLRVNNGKVDVLGFIRNFFAISSTSITAHIEAFNDAITAQLIRELGYRLQEVADNLPVNKRESVPMASIQIIHHATNVIQQNAIGSSNTQSANQSVTNEIERLFGDLKCAAISEPEGMKTKEIEEIVETALIAAKATEPKTTLIKRLLGMLPPTAAVLSITASILKIFG